MLTDYLTTAQAAERIGISVQAVTKQLRAGKIAGAVHHGRDWMVPAAVCTADAWEAVVGKPGRTPSRQQRVSSQDGPLRIDGVAGGDLGC